jgi:hypothetical protein
MAISDAVKTTCLGTSPPGVGVAQAPPLLMAPAAIAKAASNLFLPKKSIPSSPATSAPAIIYFLEGELLFFGCKQLIKLAFTLSGDVVSFFSAIILKPTPMVTVKDAKVLKKEKFTNHVLQEESLPVVLRMDIMVGHLQVKNK